jgi:hypothetical protein
MDLLVKHFPDIKGIESNKSVGIQQNSQLGYWRHSDSRSPAHPSPVGNTLHNHVILFNLFRQMRYNISLGLVASASSLYVGCAVLL